MDLIAPGTTLPNPLGVDGIRFIEFCGDSPGGHAAALKKIGMQRVAAKGVVAVHRQGRIVLITNTDPASFAHGHAQAHGAGVSALGFGVADPARAFAAAVAAGAKPLQVPQSQKLLDVPVLEGIGGSALYLVPLHDEGSLYRQAFGVDLTRSEHEGLGFFDIDHITHNVHVGRVDHWVRFYDRVFGFKPVFRVDRDNPLGQLTSMRTVAIISPSGRFRIAVNEPTEPESQIQQFIDENRGEGVQHIAFASHDLVSAIEAIRATDFPFQSTPAAYYDAIEERMPRHGEDLARLRRLGILLDGDNVGTRARPRWNSLLQIFSKNVIGPAFFEFIQRKGNDGFGERNAQALFESIEREQIRAGQLAGDRAH